jgi:putative two-component system response regulator
VLLAVALALFAAIFAARESDANAADAEGILYVVPIAMLALRYGLRGGAAGAALALGLTVAWDLVAAPVSFSVDGYLSRGVAFALLGVLLGIVVDRRRALAEEICRYYDASPDLLATADRSGRFTRVNAAWERTLGHSAATMCSLPFIDFVHPDDREATLADASLAASGDRFGFRNRYRTASGDYRWLEWNTSASPDGVIHAVARDVSAQCEAERLLAGNAAWLEANVAARTVELDRAHAETLKLLALASEYRDDATSKHTERVGVVAAAIATQLGLAEQDVKLLHDAAQLHDVGKLAIPDSILLKPGLLASDEYEVMKTHAALGSGLLSGTRSPVLEMGSVIAGSHHERWDGTGYPSGLAAERIPLAGRVVAVADVFDALTHDRPYKHAWSAARAVAEIERASGSQFDPRVVAAFLELHDTAPAAPTRAAARTRRLARPAGASGANTAVPRPRAAL